MGRHDKSSIQANSQCALLLKSHTESKMALPLADVLAPYGEIYGFGEDILCWHFLRTLSWVKSLIHPWSPLHGCIITA